MESMNASSPLADFRPDKARRPYFQEYMYFCEGRFKPLSEVVTYGEYAEHREAGTWEEFCKERWGHLLYDPDEPRRAGYA